MVKTGAGEGRHQKSRTAEDLRSKFQFEKMTGDFYGSNEDRLSAYFNVVGSYWYMHNYIYITRRTLTTNSDRLVTQCLLVWHATCEHFISIMLDCDVCQHQLCCSG